MRQLYVRWIPYMGVTISLAISPCAVANPATSFSNNEFEAQDLPSQPPLVPNPKIRIDGKLVPTGGRSRHRDYQPASSPRAVAPPVGDISISNTDSSPTLIDLGTQEKVRRLVLRDASVREVLST